MFTDREVRIAEAVIVVLRILVFSSMLVAPLFAQLDSNTITYVATRTLVEAPDQIDFTVQVVTGSGVLDNILAILQPAGITAANLTSVTATYRIRNSPLQQWTFDLAVPLAKAQQTANALNAITKSSNQVSYSWSSTRSATNLQDFLQCPAADLLAEAKTQGQAFAALAGGTLGPVLALSGQASDSKTVAAPFIGTIIDAGTGNPLPILITYSPYPANPTCTLTVKFSLLRYQ